MDFEAWLKIKLRELNTDETVFSTYISSILDGEETLEEKTEAVDEILSEIIEADDIPKVLNEIVEKWKDLHPVIEQTENIIDNVETKLAKLLESQKLATIIQKEYTPEELRIRKQILEQYSQLSADEDEEEGGDTVSEPSTACMVKNTNAHDVQQALKERREQAKLDSQKKKEKDKEDREKQKQQREEKKEKRKTVKGERRR